MAVLTATNGNVQLDEGALDAAPAAGLTIAVLIERAGPTTDGYENFLALVSGGSVVTNLGADAAAEPYELSFGQGGFTRTFGFDDLNDDEAYLFVVRKTSGEVTPRANLYRFDAGSPGWDGWADGSGTVENRGDTIDAVWLLNQPGGFPLNGGMFAAAVWTTALAEADIVHASTGLHIGVQQWLDLNPAALWRPGETDPVADESATGTADETSSAGVTIVDRDPTGFSMDFGGGAIVVNLGLAVEVDTASAFGRAKAKAFGLAAEVDAASALGRTKTRSFGLASEVDTATAFVRAKTRAIGVASEVDTASAFGRSKALALGLASEVDAALPVNPAGAIVVPIGLAVELDAAMSFGRSKVRSFGLASEIDTATSFGRAKAVQFGQAREVDTALPMTLVGAVVPTGAGGRITASTPAGRITTSTPPRTTTSTGGGRL